MDKQSFVERCRALDWKLLELKLSADNKIFARQRRQQQPFVIHHLTTGLPLLSVERGTLIGADLEGADLTSADLRGRFYGVLFLLIHSLSPILFTLLPLHLPRFVKEALISTIVLFLMSRVARNGLPPLQVDLRGAKLRNALLIGADLRGAILDGADLRGANLFAAQIRGASFKRVLFDETTIWPTGFRPPRSKRAMPAVTLQA